MSKDSQAASSGVQNHKTPLHHAQTIYYDVTSPDQAGAQMASTQADSDDGTIQQAVTVTFSKPQVHPPVYISSSMSSWRIHEMAYDVDQSSDGTHFLFYKDFVDVQPGEHMYRFRPGNTSEQWIVNEDHQTGASASRLRCCNADKLSVKDAQGHEHNIIVVEGKSNSTQLPYGSDITIADTTSSSAGQPSSLLVKTGPEPAIAATKNDDNAHITAAHLTATATDLLQTKAAELPSPHDDMSQFSELAVSPPANDSLHQHGILGEVIQDAMATAGNPETSDKSTAPLIDFDLPGTILKPQDTPLPPIVPTSTQVGSVAGSPVDNKAGQLQLDQVNSKLGASGYGLDEHSSQEPLLTPTELEPINELPELEEAAVLPVDEQKISKQVQHIKHHARHWLSTGALLVAGSTVGLAIGVVALWMMDSTDAATLETL